MNCDLGVGLISHCKTGVDCSGCGAPVFMQLQTDCARNNLLPQRAGLGGIAFSKKTEVHWIGFCSLQHA